jgi:hypothetical protein
LSKPQLTSTYYEVIKFIGGRLILSKDTRRKKPQFDDFYESNDVFIIFVDVIKVECGLEMGLIIFICRPDNGI